MVCESSGVREYGYVKTTLLKRPKIGTLVDFNFVLLAFKWLQLIFKLENLTELVGCGLIWSLKFLVINLYNFFNKFDISEPWTLPSHPDTEFDEILIKYFNPYHNFYQIIRIWIFILILNFISFKILFFFSKP